jgi:hypothetical protein
LISDLFSKTKRRTTYQVANVDFAFTSRRRFRDRSILSRLRGLGVLLHTSHGSRGICGFRAICSTAHWTGSTAVGRAPALDDLVQRLIQLVGIHDDRGVGFEI